MIVTIPAQEIKRRGISAVDEALHEGPVHVVKNNRLSYVILTEEMYADLMEAEEEAATLRVLASAAEYDAGEARVTTAAELMSDALRED